MLVFSLQHITGDYEFMKQEMPRLRQENERLRRENESLTSRVTLLQEQLLTSQESGEQLRDRIREEKEVHERERKESAQVKTTSGS